MATKQPKDDKVFARKWVKALRSGKYTQGAGQLQTSLRKDAAFCCLGVARKVDPRRFRKTAWYAATVSDDDWGKLLPSIDPDKCETLNDYKRWSFAQIATWIEKQLGLKRPAKRA